jgi:hypothetical protein
VLFFFVVRFGFVGEFGSCVGVFFGLWSISVAPVRGGTYFSLPAAKKSRQKKAAHTANS